MEPLHIIIALIGGLLAGILNTLAGNGSAITLSILTEVLGLPGNLANGTNRIGVLAQGITGSYTFFRHDKLNIRRSKWIIFWVCLGALCGVWVATIVSNEEFKSVFRFLLLAMLIVILVRPKRWLQQSNPDKKLHPLISIPIFLSLGFYGGFIQMGMGIFFLAVMVLVARYHIIEANAVKIFVVTLYTLFAVVVFQYKGLIHWQIGLVLAGGQAVGGWLAASFASRVPTADLWAYRLLVVVVILALLKLYEPFGWFG